MDLTMVIIIGNRLGNSSSNPRVGCLHFAKQEYFWEGYESNYSLSS